MFFLFFFFVIFCDLILIIFCFFCFFYCLHAHIYIIDYVVVKDDSVTWDDAKSHCVNTIGSNLVSIHNSTQNSFVFSLFPENLGWIGLNDKVTEATFEWSDGTSFNYNNWDSGIEGQNTPSEDCVSFYTT